MPLQGQKIIKWDMNEQLQIAQKVKELLDSNEGLDLLHALREAQKVLPENRRKALVGSSRIPEAFQKMFKEKTQLPSLPIPPAEGEKKEENQLKSCLPDPPPAPESPWLFGSILPEAGDASGQSSAGIQGLVTDLAAQIGHALGDMLADRLIAATSIIIKEAEARLSQRINAEREASTIPILSERFRPAMPKQELKERKKKVLIVGPLPAQQEVLRQSFPDIDLRFCSSEEGPQLAGIRAKDCDAAILMQRFMNHAHQQSVQSVLGRDKIFMAEGGVSSISKVLEDWIKGQAVNIYRKEG